MPKFCKYSHLESAHIQPPPRTCKFQQWEANFCSNWFLTVPLLTASGVYPVVSHFKMAEGQNKWEPQMQNKCPGFQLGSLGLRFVLQLDSCKRAAKKLCPNKLLYIRMEDLRRIRLGRSKKKTNELGH